MASISRILPGPVGAAGLTVRALLPPVRAVRFWVVQAGVVSLALLHDIALADMPGEHPFTATDAMTSALLLIPVMYAALNFGVRGSIATAVWASALIAPHWLFIRPLTRGHLTVELGNLAVLNVVAVIVGQRVEREQRARRRAETALHIARTASARYQSLFEQQPAPVIITDSHGTINEVNTATTRMLGPVAPGSSCQDLLSVTVSELLGDKLHYLSLRTAGGGQRLFVPTARTLASEDEERLVQIVLTDVTEQQRRQEEQREFSGRLLAVQEEDRRRLAQELHDDPLQNLMYLTRTLDDASEDAELPARLVPAMRHSGELAAEAATALRKVIHGLRPPILDDIGIVPALRQLAADVGRRAGLPVSLRCTGTEGSLSPDLKLTAYRIVQESLHNVVRHAQAGHATVWVRFGNPLILTISDDGRGIARAPEPGSCPRTGLGLIGMRERATLAGGTLVVSARSPSGTIVRATLPTRKRRSGGEPAEP